MFHRPEVELAAICGLSGKHWLLLVLKLKHVVCRWWCMQDQFSTLPHGWATAEETQKAHVLYVQ